jgi:HEAT repeat protein
MELANRSYASNPVVISSLVAALQTDPAATVRSSAARALARLGVTREEVVQALRQQRQDSDARVRLEVDNAILKLTSATGR